MKRLNQKPSLPSAVSGQLQRLGERIRTARRRRRMPIVELAQRIGVGRNTVTALERGAPTLAASTYVSALWALGLERTLDGVADPDHDEHGKILERARLPARVRKTQGDLDDAF